MTLFREAYPVDRQRRLGDMLSNGWINEDAVGLLNKLTEKFGCIAYDLGMFPASNPGEIQLTWNVAISDIREGGRKRNTTIASLILSSSGLIFQDGKSGNESVSLSWEDERLTDVIELYRTCRT